MRIRDLSTSELEGRVDSLGDYISWLLDAMALARRNGPEWQLAEGQLRLARTEQTMYCRELDRRAQWRYRLAEDDSLWGSE